MVRAFTAGALGVVLILAVPAAASELRFIGQQTIPTGTQFNGTVFGGLSGIDYDPSSGTFVAISDDRSQLSPARFYNLALNYNSSSFSGVTPISVTNMLRPDGTQFPPLSVDPESIRRAANGNLYWSSEGNFSANPALLAQPFVREMTATGTHVRDFAVPARFNYAPTSNPATGGRNNLMFESLTVSPNGSKLYTATENALNQDGPAAALGVGSHSRVIVFDTATGAAINEYVYETDPVTAAPTPAGSFVTNGLVELLAIAEGEFLALERSFSTGVGNSIRIYRASIDGATDVSGQDPLGSYTAMQKELLLDLGSLGITLDNIEGMTFGYNLDNGHRSLVLVADNNFSDTQVTQFLVFDVPEPAAALPLVGAVIMLVAARRRVSRSS